MATLFQAYEWAFLPAVGIAFVAYTLVRPTKGRIVIGLSGLLILAAKSIQLAGQTFVGENAGDMVEMLGTLAALVGIALWWKFEPRLRPNSTPRADACDCSDNAGGSRACTGEHER